MIITKPRNSGTKSKLWHQINFRIISWLRLCFTSSYKAVNLLSFSRANKQKYDHKFVSYMRNLLLCLNKWVHPWCRATLNHPIICTAMSQFVLFSTSHVIKCIFSAGAAVKPLPVLQRTTIWPGDGPCRWWSAPSWPSLDSRVRRRQRWRRWRRWCRAVCSNPRIRSSGLIVAIVL